MDIILCFVFMILVYFKGFERIVYHSKFVFEINK